MESDSYYKSKDDSNFQYGGKLQVKQSIRMAEKSFQTYEIKYKQIIGKDVSFG